MERIVFVSRLLEDGTAEVIPMQTETCAGNCQRCAGCGSHQPAVLRVSNPIGARVGDRVVVEATSGAMMKVAAALYILPAMLLIGGYLLGEYLWKQGIVVGLAGLLLGLLLVKLLDRKLSKKDKVYTITGHAKGPEHTDKGDKSC